MSASPQNISESVDTPDLERFVQDSVSTFRGHSSRLIRLERKPYCYHSSFAIEQLNATFEDGAQLKLIFKDVSEAGLLQQAKQVRPLIAGTLGREIFVYREILAGASLGTAVCYSGATYTDRRANWLLLEKIDGEELYQIGDFDAWCDAARWLAHMHDDLIDITLNCGTTLLEKYDEDYWHGLIDRAGGVLTRGDNIRGDTIRPGVLTWFEPACQQAAREVAQLPATFVHGEFYASNILIERRNVNTRVCPIDWETAGIGTGLLDLAALTAGDWSDDQKQALAKAYYDALRHKHVPWAEFDEFIEAVNNCRLLLAIKWIGWCPGWEPPVEHRFNWVQEAMQMAQAVNARGTRASRSSILK